jgi:hypothetical protein
MLRRHTALLRLAPALVLLLTTGALAQEFSGDFVQTGKNAGNRQPTKIYVGKDKMRFEGQESGRAEAGAAIIDFANNKTIILLPQQKMYIESAPGQGPFASQMRKQMLFRPDDANNACPTYEAWAKASKQSSVTCRKIGPDTVNGRAAMKYEGTSSNGTGYAWVDERLRFVSKWQDDKGNSAELRNIQEGPQAPSLFEVPSDYQKFDMQQMMRQRPSQ